VERKVEKVLLDSASRNEGVLEFISFQVVQQSCKDLPSSPVSHRPVLSDDEYLPSYEHGYRTKLICL